LPRVGLAAGDEGGEVRCDARAVLGGDRAILSGNREVVSGDLTVACGDGEIVRCLSEIRGGVSQSECIEVAERGHRRGSIAQFGAVSSELDACTSSRPARAFGRSQLGAGIGWLA